MEAKKPSTQCINSDILKKMSLKNRVRFVNLNLAPVLKPEMYDFLCKAENFYITYEKEKNITHKEDFYKWIPDFGKAGMVSRIPNYHVIGINHEPRGMTVEFLRILSTDLFDPQLAMGMGACVLAINPLVSHHENIDIRMKALKELVEGTKIGCVCITEPERGSDAIHMQTTCKALDDGSFLLNGTKIYQTNGPVANWAIVYATTETDNPQTMGQFLVDTSAEGWYAEQINIPSVTRMKVGKETLINVKVPKECVLANPGKGRDHLFEGLNIERLGIAFLNVAEAWNALSHAVIYTNLRKQFNQEILKFQGVGFPLTELWSQTMNLTLAVLYLCNMVDEKLAQFNGVLPENVSMALMATASQMKWQSAKLSEHVCYECANLMGGAGVCDNTLMADLLGISRIQEMGGGTRQIQQYLMSSALRQIFKMM